MNKLKESISFIMSAVLIISLFSTFNIVVNAVTKGNCGKNIDNVQWSFDETTGVLKIFGEGEMKNYAYAYAWEGNYRKINSIVIEEGVTSIGENAFSCCDKVTNIFISKSIKYINDNAFEDCISLKNVYYSGTGHDWEQIKINTVGNSYLINATINYNEEVHECSFGNWVVTIEPTCVDAGSKYRECSCGNKETEEIPATGEHTYVWNETHEATCTENGQETEFCSICNEKGETRVIDKLGHQTGDWEVITEATCTAEGLRVKKCTFCGKTLEEEKINKSEHHFSDWKVTKKATTEQEGEEKRTCKICKKEEVRTIDKLSNSDSTEKIIVGDANEDGKVQATDARLVLQVVAGLKDITELDFLNSDVNNDNDITATDARRILQIVAGIDK